MFLGHLLRCRHGFVVQDFCCRFTDDLTGRKETDLHKMVQRVRGGAKFSTQEYSALTPGLQTIVPFCFKSSLLVSHS